MTPEEIFNKWMNKAGIDFKSSYQTYEKIINAMNEFGKEQYNQAVKDCSKSATAYVTQETVNGSKIAKVNQESILKNLNK